VNIQWGKTREKYGQESEGDGEKEIAEGGR
jgi:hypothetical protein